MPIVDAVLVKSYESVRLGLDIADCLSVATAFALLTSSINIVLLILYQIMTKAIEHPLVPKHHNYARSEIIFGLNILRPRPAPADSSKIVTELTTISHVKLANLHPYLAAKNTVHSTINFVKQVRQVVSDSPSTSSSREGKQLLA